MLPKSSATAKKANRGKISLVACLLLCKSVMADLNFQTSGLGHRNTTSIAGIDRISLMGGSQVLIKTTGGLDMNAQLNQISLTCKQIPQATFVMPPISDDDAFTSDTAAGKLAWTIPPAANIFSNPLKQYSYFDFNNLPGGLPGAYPHPSGGIDYLTFDVDVASADFSIGCVGTAYTKCKFQYDQRYTPEIYDVSPNQVTAGELINIYINPMQVWSSKIPNSMEPFQDIRIGDRTTDWEGLIDVSTRPASYKVSSIATRVGDNRPAKSVDPDVNYTLVGRSFIRETAKHCNFAGDDCWTVRVHPNIEKISAASGYLTGGQILEVTGFGLTGQDIKVKVDGVSCLVNYTLSSDKSIICETGSKITPSLAGVPQPGNFGVTHSYVNPSDPQQRVDWSQIKTNVFPTTKSLKTTLETLRFVYDEKSAHSFDGWFYAPETGQYKFYLSADDQIRFYMDTIRPYSATVPYTQNLYVDANLKAYSYYYPTWRQYEKEPAPQDDPMGKYQSDWLNLEGGKYYKFAYQHIDYQGEYWSIGSVEFTKPGFDAADHPKASKAIQNLRIEANPNQAEKWTITCDNVTSSSTDQFILSLTSPNSSTVFQSQPILCRHGAYDVYSRIQAFFQDCNGGSYGICSNISTYRTMYTSAGVVTTNSSQATKYVFDTYLRKRINGSSFISFQVTPVGVITSTVTVTPPYAGGVLSSGAISGSFKISCPDPQGTVWTTRANAWNLENSYIQANMDEDIPWLRGKVTVHTWTDGTIYDLFKFSYRQNGLNIYLTFDGLHSDPPLCSILSDTVTPMAIGNGGTLAYHSEWVRHYGSGLMFEPVGLEFMRTDALSPQVIVKIDGLEALCTGVNCDYSYVQSEGVITAQSYNSATQVITIQGTSLPTTDIKSSFGGATCSNTPTPVFTDTLIECTLLVKPSAGFHKVEIKTSQGLIPIEEGVSSINIPLVVSAVSPAQVNPLGGALITISGEGFPSNANLVTVTFSDDTNCVVKSSSYNELVCRVSGFSNNDGASRTIIIAVFKITNDDGVALLGQIASNSSQTLGFIQNLPKVVSIDKTNVSPILKQSLTFSLDDAYTDTLVASELRVELRQAASNYSRELYIMSVDNSSSPKTFTVKFNGAPIGSYTFYVEANSPSQYGQLNTAAISINTESTITSVSPVSGSVLGGTILTITGTNFSSTISDQAVKVGKYYCDILTASPTQLTCRVRNTNRPLTATSLNNEVIVVLAAAAEAEALCVGLCMFEFATPSATIDTITSAFNPATNNIELTVVGSGFEAGQIDQISLLIDGKSQNLKSVESDTSIVFTLSDIEREATSSITILFEDGLPANYQSLIPITFTPSFAKVYPNSDGSFGGTLLTISAPGIGVKTGTVNLFSAALNKNLCSEAIVTGYGTFTCLTGRDAILTTDTLKIVVGTLKYDCVNSEPQLCRYSQMQSTSPTITSAVRSNNVITFNGTLFPSQESFTLLASYQSMKVPITSWTETMVIATFPLGIPASAANLVPRLAFTRIADSVVFYANYQSAANVQNPLNVTAADSTSDLSVSYAGGLQYTVTKSNVYATLLEKANRLEICGNICKPIDASSDINQMTCTLPALTTSYSAATYQIVEPSILSGTWTGTSATQVLNVFDGIYSTEYTHGGNCFIQLAFPEGQVGVLDSAKVLINGLAGNKSPFAPNTILQGFDGTNYVDLWRLDMTINEGWNTKNFEDGSKPAYSAYRWSSTQGGCRFGEVVFTGIIAKSDPASSTQCTAKLFIGTASQTLSMITYTATSTPKIDQIQPRYGKVSGNELITITGDNFVDGATTVTIDNITCAIQSVTATQITCLTGQRIGDEPNPSFVVFVTGRGIAVNQGNTFTYVQYWSEPSTWGNDAPPQFGEAVQIPKGRTLLVDVDKVPQLSFVLVEGALIFAPHPDPTHIRAFDAGYIFIKGGYMEVGTEEHPYTSKLTITMHGDVTTPAIPTFGNKNIAVMHGTLSMVGKSRSVVWTLLDSTVLPNAIQITLMPQASTFDWAVGEQIVIAPTGYSKNEAEVRTIVAVGSDHDVAAKPVLTLDRPLLYKHYAATETYGDDFIDMRAEVGLLTRNVKFRGDPETSAKNQYGAHIMLHGMGEESTVGKIMYIELTDVGQAFKLGRYPIHFHMLGKVVRSIVKGNSIHQTYNRGITIHAVSYFRVIQNVIYNTMGHTIFIEDAIETKNIIDGNLVIKTNRSWSLLNVDQTPASFWITNPDNTIINNRAAGSDRYGFWFDLQTNPTGVSFTNTICPSKTRLGEFRNNVAHSNGRYGLRIFDSHNPRTYPCSALTYDNSNPSAVGAPYPSNPVISAVYQDFTGWKNVENGAISESTGAVVWKNFKVADNMVSGMEWSTVAPEIRIDGLSMIDGALVIGKSQNTEEGLDIASPHGVIGPRTEWFTAQNVKFYSFGFINGSYALGDCSHCFFAASTDSGARTITVRGLQFDNTVTRRIRYEYPHRGIFFDADGSLTGLGAGSWASANFKHNEQPECQTNLAVYDGQICDNTVQVRRIAFHGIVPTSIEGLNLRVAKFDDAQTALLTEVELNAYKLDLNNYSKAPMTVKLDPVKSWAVPYVTGHKYRWFFDAGQLDIQNMKIDVSLRWQPTDKYLLLNLPYTDNREHIDIYRSYNQVYATSNSTGLIADNTLQQSNYANWESGFNFNDKLTKREFNMVITGNPAGSRTLQLNGVRCRDNLVPWCAPPIPPTSCTGTTKLWSAPATWPSGVLPVDGDNVTIPSGEIIVFDLAESPILNLIKVDGCLEFLNSGVKDQHLKAYQIFVSSGKFNIGSTTTPYTRKAKITLYGDINSQTVTMANAAEAGNKLIANNGEVKMYGLPRSRMSRLLAEAQKGATTVTVETGLDWVAGDMLGFAATGLKHKEAESATIQSYNSATGIVVLTAPLEFYHFGRAVSTAQNYQGLDMRGEIILLTRNIVIQGDSTQNDWQGQFVTSDALKVDSTGNIINLQGLTILKNVEFNNMGQLNTTKAALRFDNSKREGAGVFFSSVQNSVFHHNGGFAISVVLSKNVSVQNCDIFHAKQIGVNIDVVTNVNFDSVNVFDVRQRDVIESMNFADKETCVAFCTYTDGTNCFTSSYTNSIIGGCPFAGILTQGYSCTDPVGQSSTTVIKNLVVHSVDGSGASFMPNRAFDEHKNCYQFSHISAYKNRGGGIGTMYQTLEMRASNIVLVDNQLGITLNISGPEDSQRVIKFSDSVIYGENSDLSNDCPDSATGAVCYCPDKYGFMNFHGQLGLKDAHIQSQSKRPIYNVKTDAIWDTKVQLNNIDFVNFKSTATACNARQSAFGISAGYSPDQIPIHKFFNTKFTNVHPNAIAYMKDPLPQWASIDNCGQFPCTGWSNIVINFYDALFEVTDGATPLPTYWTASTTAYDFQIIGKVTAAGQSYSDCSFNAAMNAYFCADPYQELPPQIGVLVFESLDEDSRTRTVSPVIITNESGYENTINSFMDHAWDGFYTSQNRLSRFIAHVQTGLKYTMNYTGTPPKNMRYTLRSDVNTSGVTIKVPYPDAGSYDVLVDSNLITPQPWDTATKQQAVINPVTAVCGSNRYVGVQNYLEFFVTPGCTVLVRPRDAILTSVRLEWTLDEFFAGDGVTTFVQRLASVLGIDPSRVKVVSVYAGSVNVEVQILQDFETVESKEDGSVIPTEAAYIELALLQDKIDTVLVPTSTGGGTTENILGAPILEVQTDIKAEILGDCTLKQEQCPQSWPVKTGRGFNEYKCIKDTTLSLSWSGSSGASNERCDYVAKPDVDAINCQCICNQDPNACPAATPYFDPSQCKCVCPYKNKCEKNWTFIEESCSCVCKKIEEGCPAHSPTLDKKKCTCDCKLSEDKCPRAFPEFDDRTCSCKCSLSATICAQNKTNKKFDQAKCACKK